ncbi:MAG: leucyl aminopeptidase [Pseudomonadota bacterium]
MDMLEYQKCGALLSAHIQKTPDKKLTLQTTLEDAHAAHLAYGFQTRQWRFERYITKNEYKDKNNIAHLEIVCANPQHALRQYQPLKALLKGMSITRDLVSAPPNELHPESFADFCLTLKEHGLNINVLDEKQMRDLNMNALLGVGQGSARESRLVTLEWRGQNAKNKQPVAFVGKGVTFDTGGISLKPGLGMEEMKWDMGGAGVVCGLLATLALRKASVHAVGLIGLVENMPDGNAQRPGDIVRSMSGQTIEIHNTDAEGRLVLADVLHYACINYNPQSIIDLATLTGAIIISLGHEYAGLFSNDDTLSQLLIDAGKLSGDEVWRLPLGDEYDKLLKTDGADMKNIGGRGAGSITAAQFLQRFVGSTKWAHLDIAGVTWQNKDRPLTRKGASGFGVALLNQFVKNNFG